MRVFLLLFSHFSSNYYKAVENAKLRTKTNNLFVHTCIYMFKRLKVKAYFL